MHNRFKNILLFAFTFLVTTACFAQTPTETLSVSGLKDSVIVRRDDRSIPYIEAKDDVDLYFAQGYVTAQDRLWQMDLYRRVAGGRTAEIFGSSRLDEDKRWRRFGFANVVEETYKNYLTPELRAVLDNYTRGVNAYISTLNKDSLPPEFRILQYQPEEWKPTDSMLIGKILSDALSTSWYDDAMRAKFKDLPKELFDELFIEKTPYDVLVVGKDLEVQSPKPKVQSLKSESRNLFEFADNIHTAAIKDAETRKRSLESIGFYQEFNAASNNWVVSGKRTLDGKAILANDPHLQASAPSIWYLTNLSSPTQRVSGVTFPGTPGVVLGHNEFIAWGATNLEPDAQDLYIETFNDKNEYKTEKGFRAAKIRTEEIKVRPNPLKPETEVVKLEVIETDDGIIIQDDGTKKTALKWTALDPKNNEFGAFYRLDLAKNWNEFKAALKTYGGATQNFVYADTQGNIGFHNGGAIPIRSSGDGSVPYDGSKNVGKWTGYIPFEELPESYNPPEGFIVTANQRIAGDSYPHFLGHGWANPFRARRIYQLLAANEKVTVNDCMTIQSDLYDIARANFAREIVKIEAASDETLKIIRGWDGRASSDSVGVVLVAEIQRNFLNAILKEKLGEQKANDYRWSNSISFTDWLIREKPDDWMPKEGYKAVLLKADATARESLTKKYGADQAKWTLGALYKINFVHPLAVVPLIGVVFAIEPLPYKGGGGTVVNAGASVSMRHITAAGDWDNTRHGITLGESGDPKSPFYKDQLESWYSGNTPVFLFSKAAIEKSARRVVLMNPK